MKLSREIVFRAALAAALYLSANTSWAAKNAPKAHNPGVPAGLELQVLLDRANFSPGEIDGAGGRNTEEALAAFRASRHIRSGPRGGDAALRALGAGRVKTIVTYTITAEDTAGPFAQPIPEDMTEMSKLPGLYYTSVLEELGEKFHSSPALLMRLNPGAAFAAGEGIRVPNVPGTAPSGTEGVKEADGNRSQAPEHDGDTASPHAGMVAVVVSKQKSSLTVHDQKGAVIFYAPVTSGSEHDPLPLGNWEVTLIQRNPAFNYSPELFWDSDPANAKAKIAPGPNNPVGVVWIEINKPHYGIHGTPEPGRIGHSESHGCVRLTNWDALAVAGLVTKGTLVRFEP